MEEEIFALIDQRLQNRDRESLADFIQRTHPHLDNLSAQAGWVFSNREEVLAFLSNPETLQAAIRHSLRGVKDFVYTRNQFLDLDRADRAGLRAEYALFYRSIREELQGSASLVEFNARLEWITLAHLARLTAGLDRAARRSAADPAQKPAFLATVACGEYSPQAQLSTLHLDIPLEEPVLDVGCGSQANLARYLADLGVEVLGIDRSAPDELFCQTCAWEEFDYGAGRWGTILSHQSFSTHFTFNHRHSGQERPIEMARTFMRMLAGLRPGGALVYAPGLPFIEPLLEQKTGYNLHRYPIPGIPGALAGIAYACHIHFATNFG